MSKRLSALFVAGMVSLAGLALAQEPSGKEEPPVRLKKKPRSDDKPMVDPDKPAEKKKDDKKGDKKEDKKAEPRELEPVTPQEDEKEVLQRVVANVHKVGDRLAKNDLGQATQQTQRDILKDLESLIRRNEDPPQGGGGEQDQNNGGGGGGQNKKGQKGRGGKSGSKSGAGSKSAAQQGRSDSKSGGGKQDATAGSKNNKGGTGGGSNSKEERGPNRTADQYKDIWGHLPQTLRAQMDAYSNPQPFMPKYDDLIKRYYRTIAEQGRRNGE